MISHSGFRNKQKICYYNIELNKHFGEVKATCYRENKEKGIKSSFMDQDVCQGDGAKGCIGF